MSYIDVSDSGDRLKRDILFCYDLELPVEFIPSPCDGEVQDFQLRDIDWILNTLYEGGPNGFKSNINVTMIDFLIRYSIMCSLKIAF